MTLKEAVQILDISPPVTRGQLTKAYVDGLAKWHPDRVAGNAALAAEAKEQLHMISEAHGILNGLPESGYPFRVSGGEMRDPSVSAILRPPPPPQPAPQPSRGVVSARKVSPLAVIGCSVMGLAAIGLAWATVNVALRRAAAAGQIQQTAADVPAAQTAVATAPPIAFVARPNDLEDGRKEVMHAGAPAAPRSEDESGKEAAFKSALMAAEQGLPAAQVKVGLSYKNGVGVAKDLAEALRWFQRAASGGLESAGYEAAWCLLNGGKYIEDHGKAVALLHPLAQKGNPDAQYLMGEACFAGKGGRQSDKVAVQWWELAAEQGHAAAQNRLSLAYQRGIGVTPDMEKAAQWLRKAGEQRGEDAALADVATEPPRAATAPPPPLPSKEHVPKDKSLKSGELLTDRFRGFGGKGQLILDNGLVDDAYVKVVGGGKVWVSFYLRGGETFTFDHVPDGTYQVIYCTGFDWDPKARDFGRGQHAVRYERKLDFTTMHPTEKTQNVVSNPVFTLTLRAVSGGEFPTSDLPMEEFNSF